ncbi:helix-turn-helix domain-containing protein [Streptomyces ziwulingensis]
MRKWRGRFAAGGPDGLRDAERSGRPRTYGPNVRVAIVAMATSAPPHPEAGRTGPSPPRSRGPASRRSQPRRSGGSWRTWT